MPDIGGAIDYIKCIFTNYRHPGEAMLYISIFYYIVPLIVIDWLFRRNERELQFLSGNTFKVLSSRVTLYAVYIITVLFLMNAIIQKENASFIYFQF